MGFKTESQLKLHLMKQAPTLTQVYCILIKKGLKKTQETQLNKKTNSQVYALKFTWQSKN